MSYRTEPQIFKTRFKSWDDILAVDFTCTPEMLEKRKMELVCFHGVCLGLSVSLSVSLPVYIGVCLVVCFLSVCLDVFFLFCFFVVVFVFVCLDVCRDVCLDVCLSGCHSLFLSGCLFLSVCCQLFLCVFFLFLNPCLSRKRILECSQKRRQPRCVYYS